MTDLLKPSGLTYEELCEKTWELAPKDDPSGTCPYNRYEKGQLRPDGKPGFRTPTGKIELYSTVFESYGVDPLPHHKEPIESPSSTPEIYKEYPLILITGRRNAVFFHSEHRQIPWLREIEPDPTVELNPETAAKLGLQAGEWVWVEGVRGKFKRKLKLTPQLHPLMAHALHGWWLPEAEGKAPYFYGIWELNVNQLIPMDCQSSSGFGGAPNKTMLCKIYKVKE